MFGGGGILWCATEMLSKADIDNTVSLVKEFVKGAE